MKHDYSYEFGHIILKPLEEADIESMRILRNKVKDSYLNNNEIDAESQKKWYQRYLEKQDDIMFKVVKKDKPDEFIGAMGLYDIDWENGISETGRTMLDKEKVPEKGIGIEIMKATCLFGFEVLKLKKIVAEVLKNNKPSLGATKRTGFRTVGEEGDYYLIEITLEDVKRDEE